MAIGPITDSEIRTIALEEGLRAAFALDKMRLAMLNQAVQWICDNSDLTVAEARKKLAGNLSGQVGKQLATMAAVRGLLTNE